MVVSRQRRHSRACPGHPRSCFDLSLSAWEPGTSPGMTMRRHPLTAHRLEEFPDVANIQLRLLECGEMPALLHLAPVRDVGKVRLHPAPDRRDDLLGEHGDAGRHVDPRRGAAFAKTL